MSFEQFDDFEGIFDDYEDNFDDKFDKYDDNKYDDKFDDKFDDGVKKDKCKPVCECPPKKKIACIPAKVCFEKKICPKPVCKPVCEPVCEPVCKPVCKPACKPVCKPVWSELYCDCYGARCRKTCIPCRFDLCCTPKWYCDNIKKN